MGILFCICGARLIIWSLVINAKDYLSAIAFKVVPFFIGAFNLVYGLSLLNVLMLGGE